MVHDLSGVCLGLIRQISALAMQPYWQPTPAPRLPTPQCRQVRNMVKGQFSWGTKSVPTQALWRRAAFSQAKDIPMQHLKKGKFGVWYLLKMLMEGTRQVFLMFVSLWCLGETRWDRINSLLGITAAWYNVFETPENLEINSLTFLELILCASQVLTKNGQCFVQGMSFASFFEFKCS